MDAQIMTENTITKIIDAKIIDGRAIALELESKVALVASELKTQHNINPCLGVILVEGNPASEIYVRRKHKKAETLGIKSLIRRFPKNVKLSEISKQIDEWNNDNDMHGILVQLPLPNNQESYPLIQMVAPEKDIDGLHALNIGKLSWQKEPSLTACTPSGCIILLESVIDDFTGLHAVIVGTSNLVGRPMMQLLLQKNCTVSMTHSKTKDLGTITKQADILIVATGRPKLITADMVKPDVTIIDVGINRIENNKITGDVCTDDVLPLVKAITPVPGGVGPMTIACMMRNTVLAAHLQNNIKPMADLLPND